MQLRFFWQEYHGRFHPACECLGQEHQLLLLCSFLMDDGGLGLKHQIPWLRECIAKCERVTRGVTASEDFTTECFAADLGPSKTMIHSISLEPDSGEPVQTGVFLRIVCDWVAFLERGKQEHNSDVVVHDYSV